MSKRIHPKPVSLAEIFIKFSTDEQCLEYVEKMRWPDGVVRCPHAAMTRSAKLSAQRELQESPQVVLSVHRKNLPQSVLADLWHAVR